MNWFQRVFATNKPEPLSKLNSLNVQSYLVILEHTHIKIGTHHFYIVIANQNCNQHRESSVVKLTHTVLIWHKIFYLFLPCFRFKLWLLIHFMLTVTRYWRTKVYPTWNLNESFINSINTLSQTWLIVEINEWKPTPTKFRWYNCCTY